MSEQNPVAATNEEEETDRKRKTPSDDPRARVAEFQEAMDSVLEETLRLMEEHEIPDDWAEFDPCDENGGMYWKWERINGQYCLWVFADSNLATVENMETTEVLELVSVSKAVRRLKRMMQEDEEEDDE